MGERWQPWIKGSYVSSCMRFVSIGASLSSSDGTTLTGRDGGGDSTGFGCVRVKGSSTVKSLQNVQHVLLSYTCLILFI